MSIRVENYYDEPVEFPSEIDGWYLDVDRKHFRLSDKPYPGHSGTTSYYLANPSEVPLGREAERVNRAYLYDIWFAPSVTAIHFLVWAHSFEQALELAAEEASSMGFRGVFTDEPRTEADEADLTYTESGWIISHEWGGGDVGYGELSRAAVAVCSLYMAETEQLVPNATKRKDPAVAGGEFAIRYAEQREVPQSCAARYEIAEHAAKMGSLRGEAVRTFTAAALAEWETGEPSVPAPRAAARGGSPKERMLEAFDRLNAAGGGRYYVTLADLRDALSDLSRAGFDDTLNQLRRDWVLTLSPAEGLHETVPRRVLDAGIKDGPQNLVYVLRRESSQGDDEDDESSDYERVIQAFDRLSKKQKSPHIIIADVVDESGLSIPRVHDVIRELIRRREGQTVLGEPSRATPRQLAAGFDVGHGGHRNSREMYMTVFGGDHDPEPARDIIMNALVQLEQRERTGALIPVSHVREASGLPKATFDRTALEMFGDDQIILHHHDYVGNLTPEEREELIKDKYGTYYVGMAVGRSHKRNGSRRRPEPKFQIGDRARVTGTQVQGKIDYGPFWDEHLGDYRYKISPDDGSGRRTWNEKSLRRLAKSQNQNGGDRLRAGEEAFRLKPGYGDQWASSPERAWEGVYVTETLSRGAQGFGVSMGGRVLFDRQVRVVRVSGRFYAQPV
jgi:hypothetical protein